MDTRTIVDSREARPPNPYDLDGTLDTTFVDELGMKTASVRTAKGGIIIGSYEDNVLTEVFYSADLLVETFTAPKRSHHKKARSK